MSYSSAAVLQMPSSYVPMSTEEMEYLEGGLRIANWVVGGFVNLAFDVALAATGGWFFNRGDETTYSSRKNPVFEKTEGKANR